MTIRNETATDADMVRQTIEAAFAGAPHSSGTEAAIVEALRDAGALSLSLVADKNHHIVGHIAFSPVMINGMDTGWFGLGPVSVTPQLQGKGIGAELIRDGLSRLADRGAGGCVVLGEPGYYARFGFIQASALKFEGVPPEYFMSLTLRGVTPAGTVTYQPAFHE